VSANQSVDVIKQVITGEVPLKVVVEVLEPLLASAFDGFIAWFDSEDFLGVDRSGSSPEFGTRPDLDETAALHVVDHRCVPTDSPGRSDQVAVLANACAVTRVEEQLDFEGAGQRA
jgi:hypothetical protein